MYCRQKAHAVFNGKVFVPKPAQLTDAAQLNRNLLLSPKARVDTKPQLEITADNVKCSHGATVSQLEDDEIFYLQSRGLDRKKSQFVNQCFCSRSYQPVANYWRGENAFYLCCYPRITHKHRADTRIQQSCVATNPATLLTV